MHIVIHELYYIVQSPPNYGRSLRAPNMTYISLMRLHDITYNVIPYNHTNPDIDTTRLVAVVGYHAYKHDTQANTVAYHTDLSPRYRFRVVDGSPLLRRQASNDLRTNQTPSAGKGTDSIPVLVPSVVWAPRMCSTHKVIGRDVWEWDAP